MFVLQAFQVILVKFRAGLQNYKISNSDPTDILVKIENKSPFRANFVDVWSS